MYRFKGRKSRFKLFGLLNPLNLVYCEMQLKRVQKMRNVWLFSVIAILVSCTPQKASQSLTPTQWAVKMAESDMQRNPESWMLDFSKSPKWAYCQGLVTLADLKLWKATGNTAFYDYAKSYADTTIDENGIIRGYKLKDYNIDKINAGKILFPLYDETGDLRYKTAMDTLRQQMREHPRTSEGGFWHKQGYPWQMWLDGLYMGVPFLAQYAYEFKEDSLFDDIALQIKLIHKHLRDKNTGLYRHGWDESRQMAWADSITGQSLNVWGRGMGWYAMSVVDVLEFFPETNANRDSIVAIAEHLAVAMETFQDDSTGLWYQVVDKGEKEGNYVESSASTMFVYFLFKAINNGNIPASYIDIAKKGYEGILEHFISENPDGTINIDQACAGAGLGGRPYRSGTYDYYIEETIRANDPKSVGPFIMLCLEYEKWLENNKN